MDSQLWPDELRHKLRKQNLPAAYINRLVEELSDHLLDTQSEHTSMDAQTAFARLGSADTIATAASREFRSRTFAGRHPYLTFVFGPLAFVPAIFLGLLFGPYCILATLYAAFALVTGNEPFPASEESGTLSTYWVACCYHHFFRFVPFALAALFFCRWGRKSAMQRWAMLSCGIVAAMAGATVSIVRPVDGNFAEWMLMFGLAIKLTVNQLLQFLVPLAVAAWLLLRVPQRLSPSSVTPNAAAI
ncbi:MAG TPA: hypothetical protein VGI40_11770 [Pirellulaceae bacterium]|jgi:hypothetical protein